MFVNVVKAIKVPLYAIAATLLVGAYVYLYYDYVQTVTDEAIVVTTPITPSY